MQPQGRPAEKVDGGDNISREQIKEQSGLSDRELTTALRVAAVPRERFEELIEAERPAPIHKIAEEGTAKRESHTSGRSGAD